MTPTDQWYVMYIAYIELQLTDQKITLDLRSIWCIPGNIELSIPSPYNTDLNTTWPIMFFKNLLLKSRLICLIIDYDGKLAKWAQAVKLWNLEVHGKILTLLWIQDQGYEYHAISQGIGASHFFKSWGHRTGVGLSSYEYRYGFEVISKGTCTKSWDRYR